MRFGKNNQLICAYLKKEGIVSDLGKMSNSLAFTSLIFRLQHVRALY